MVRLSSPISSRLILAAAYAAIGGFALYGAFWLLYGENASLETASFLYKSPDHGLLEDIIEFINMLGPIFGTLAFTAPFLPFTFIYASWVCPSRITITDTEIRAKFFSTEKRYPITELTQVSFQTANDNQFIIFKVAGKTLKAEIEHGIWGRIRDLLPPEIAYRATAKS
ncbi:hypothetical protein VDG1235_3832 [Verrucomicrobiia bacterium DG1235]|nr:hypothetical protein VDG1235_3832 [Verrucomicrobiae bacterium DG1235]